MGKPKRGHRRVKFSSAEMSSDLPRELEFGKLRVLGRGPNVVRTLATRSKRMVGLDDDVARVFSDSESVNNVLRAIISSLPARTRKTRKSA